MGDCAAGGGAVFAGSVMIASRLIIPFARRPRRFREAGRHEGVINMTGDLVVLS